MKAIVCDKCGKVILLEDSDPRLYAPAGIYRLLHVRNELELELCEDCGDELIAAVRLGKDGEGRLGGRIICGFAGVGKSTLAKKRANVVDLESTPFQKDWQTYARVANHMKNNGYTVLVSCHNEMRTQLHNDGVEYDVVLPNQNCKEVFMMRYANRGNTEAFVRLLDEKWEAFCQELPWENALRINTEFLEDLIHQLPQKGR